MKQNYWIVAAGVALVTGFFLPWFDLGAGFQATGLDIVRESEISWITRLAVLLTPLLGVSMIASGLGASKNTAKLSLGVGCSILGFAGYKIADAFLSVSGSGLWLVLAAGLVSLTAGLALKPTR
jgi:hypothetical protein